MRYPEECARHKILDMVGDLALLGFDLHGFVVAHRSGHQTNHALARRLLEQVTAQPAPSSGLAATLGENGVIDINGIMSLLPHRYPFLLIDRVLELDPGRRAVAIKNVSVNEPFFRGHWPGQPIMPGVLIVEALAQAAGVLIAASVQLQPGRVVLMASLDGVKLRRPVVPGDQTPSGGPQAERSSPTRLAFTAWPRWAMLLAAEAQLRFVMVNADRDAGSGDRDAARAAAMSKAG